VHSYLQDFSVVASVPVSFKGQEFRIVSYFKKSENFYVASFSGVKSREDALPLVKESFFINESSLPGLRLDEYYQKDLVGLDVINSKILVGSVIAVYNFGASDILEVKLNSGKDIMVPFVKEFVTSVDLRSKNLSVILPS